jgi:predicted PurR-regulated permease PerM
MRTPSHVIQTRFFFLMFGAVSVITILLVLPFYKGLIFAATLAVVFYPLHQFLLKHLGRMEWLSAVTTMAIALAAVLVPLSFIGYQLFTESRGLYISLSDDGSSGGLAAMIERPVKNIFPSYDLDVRGLMRSGADYVTSKVGDIFSATLQTLMNIIIGILAFFFFIKEGPRLKERVMALSPLPDSFDERILDRISRTMRMVMRGSILVALIQGTMAGIGFALFGVPNPVFWGTVTAVCSLIPGFGTSLVVIPAVAYLYFTGDLWQPIGMAAWGISAVGLIDNALAPYLVGKGVRIHPLIILLAVLGGIGLFGPLGFLIGPIVISFFFTLLDVYQQMIVERRQRVK